MPLIMYNHHIYDLNNLWVIHYDLKTTFCLHILCTLKISEQLF